mmetsp:Transcript_1674/g.4825  ORF Transcript_1674/g.4825 Transcript_1674/m.4825 type:complete len:242 (+) Transcript_1674:721-1446(+)
MLGGGASLTCCLARTSLQTTRTTWTLMWQARGHQTATIVMGAAAVSQSAMGGALTATLVVWMTSVTGARERSRTGRTSSGAFRRRLRPAWRADRRKGSRRRRPPSWSAFLQSGGGRLWTTRRSTRRCLGIWSRTTARAATTTSGALRQTPRPRGCDTMISAVSIRPVLNGFLATRNPGREPAGLSHARMRTAPSAVSSSVAWENNHVAERWMRHVLICALSTQATATTSPPSEVPCYWRHR